MKAAWGPECYSISWTMLHFPGAWLGVYSDICLGPFFLTYSSILTTYAHLRVTWVSFWFWQCEVLNTEVLWDDERGSPDCIIENMVHLRLEGHIAWATERTENQLCKCRGARENKPSSGKNQYCIEELCVGIRYDQIMKILHFVPQIGRSNCKNSQTSTLAAIWKVY